MALSANSVVETNLKDPRWNNLNSFRWKSEDSIVKCLERRFLDGEYYTWAGLSLVAVNPCQEIPSLYSEDVKELYNSFGEGRSQTALKPHLYAIAARTRHRLVYETGKANQAIVISGDSGSGKTFSARHLLNFLATYGFHKNHYDVAKVSETLWQIWCSVPVLAAFGNAQTECNNNSSRFGKLLQLQYKNDNIVGASIETYLLEKTRVASQGIKERNFHIFHQLLAGLSHTELEALHLCHNTQYKIVPGRVTPEDSHSYIETMAALMELGINCDLKQQVLILLAAIIHLGNITFISRDDMYVVNKHDNVSLESLQSASQLLGLQDSCLTQLLTSRQIVAHSCSRRRPSVYHKPAGNVEECTSRRDCLMRFLYERLFHWIISTINTKVKAEGQNFKQLGILDIYGFEVFEHNSLEQLCINYANERLQHFFVQDVLLEQLQILQDEGLEAKVASYSENQERLKLLDAPISVFGILNEECALQRFTNDKVICQRIISNLCDNKYLLPTPSYDASQFIIRHYARDVCYDVKQMLDKNMDKLPKEMVDLLGLSSSYFIRQILQQRDVSLKDKYNNRPTLLSKFKNSLDDLINILKEADVHYIHCVKTTPHLAPQVVYTSFFKQQLQASGILEAISLSQQYFPVMFRYTEFEHRYGMMMNVHAKKQNIDSPGKRELGQLRVRENRYALSSGTLKDILCAQDLGSHIMLGRFTLFLTESTFLQLETYRHQQRVEAADKIQRMWRKHLKKRLDAVILIQRSFKKWFREKMVKIDDSMVFNKEVTPEPDSTNKYIEAEKVINFIRSIHFGEGIISRQVLAKIPIRFHTRLTCLPNSHVLPFSELPKGLEDAIF